MTESQLRAHLKRQNYTDAEAEDMVDDWADEAQKDFDDREYANKGVTE